MKRTLALMALATSLLHGGLWGADLTLTYVQPATAAIDWSGINETNGDGSVTFASLGDTQAATLSVLCNSANGYKITFNTANATAAGASERPCCVTSK